jgi:hypothetical protein
LPTFVSRTAEPGGQKGATKGPQMGHDYWTLIAPFLNGGTLFFGVAQKALNLYLKYLWCWDPNFIPPHCPFDDKIIKALGALPVGVDTKWTTSNSVPSYRAWVAAARTIAGTNQSLAEWELEVWS